jgi:hypothetical protein
MNKSLSSSSITSTISSDPLKASALAMLPPPPPLRLPPPPTPAASSSSSSSTSSSPRKASFGNSDMTTSLTRRWHSRSLCVTKSLELALVERTSIFPDVESATSPAR